MATNTKILEVQQQLSRLGFDPGELDGIWGRHTIAALREFQKANGLKVDGIFGPASRAALFRGAVEEMDGAAATLPWMAEAQRLIHTKEFLGKRNNPAILDWADDLDLHYPGDEVPWCGLFVGHCIASTLPEEALPTSVLRARAWGNFGKKTEPVYGAVMVFSRLGEQSGKGHVGFYVGQNATAYCLLGGNQSDSVCYAWISKKSFMSAQWPVSAVSLRELASAVEITENATLTTALG